MVQACLLPFLLLLPSDVVERKHKTQLFMLWIASMHILLR
jgi:hypothetical protein